MDSFERAIYQIQSPSSATSDKTLKPQSMGTPNSPTKSGSHTTTSCPCPPSKPEAFVPGSITSIEAGQAGTTDQDGDQYLEKWRNFCTRHRRLLYMLGTIVLVLVASIAIAGGVIWKLTTMEV
jgi:hypothetical protein